MTVTREQLQSIAWSDGPLGRYCRACFSMQGECVTTCWIAAALTALLTAVTGKDTTL
jgi:hypothetical protein